MSQVPSSSFTLQRALVGLCCSYVFFSPTHPTLTRHIFGTAIPTHLVRLLSISRVLASYGLPALKQAVSYGLPTTNSFSLRSVFSTPLSQAILMVNDVKQAEKTTTDFYLNATFLRNNWWQTNLRTVSVLNENHIIPPTLLVTLACRVFPV